MSWTLVYSQAERQGPPGKPLCMNYNNTSSEKQVKETISNMSQNWLPPCNTAIDRRMLEPTEKKTLHIQGQRRSRNETVGGAQSC